MGKSKSPAPVAPPRPVETPIAQKPAEPIQRNATNSEARDRAAANPSAQLLDDPNAPKTGTAASMMS